MPILRILDVPNVLFRGLGTSLGVAAFAWPLACQANGVRVDNSVLIERHSRDSSGNRHLILEPAQKFQPGDRLVYVLTYRHSGRAATGTLVLTNPMPESVAFQSSADGNEVVSVDGGRTWGSLDDLKIRASDGRHRKATPEDVTHIRWQIASGLDAGESGKLTFRAIVRR